MFYATSGHARRSTKDLCRLALSLSLGSSYNFQHARQFSLSIRVHAIVCDGVHCAACHRAAAARACDETNGCILLYSTVDNRKLRVEEKSDIQFEMIELKLG